MMRDPAVLRSVVTGCKLSKLGSTTISQRPINQGGEIDLCDLIIANPFTNTGPNMNTRIYRSSVPQRCHRWPRCDIMATWSSLIAPEVVMTTTVGATIDNKISIMTTLGLQ